jgi:hypothetical protein
MLTVTRIAGSDKKIVKFQLVPVDTSTSLAYNSSHQLEIKAVSDKDILVSRSLVGQNSKAAGEQVHFVS